MPVPRSRPAPPRPTASSSPTSRAETVPSPCASTASPIRPTPGDTSFRSSPMPASARSPPSNGVCADRRYPTDGVATRSGALSMDAIALHDALGGDERRRARRSRLGRTATVYGAAGHAPERWRRVVAMAVPPGGALGPRLRDQPDPAQAVLVHVLLPAPAGRPASCRADDLAFVDMLWRDWSPGFDATEELALLKPSLRDPANLAAALGYYRARLGDGKKDPALDAVQQATQDVPPQPLALPARRRRRLHRRRGGRGGAVDGARQRHGRDRRRRRPLPPPRAARGGQPPRSSSSSRRDAIGRRLPDGLVAVVKRDCATCLTVVPVLRRAGPRTRAAHGLHAGRPVVPFAALARATTPTSPSPGTTTSRPSPPCSGSATARRSTGRWAGAAPTWEELTGIGPGSAPTCRRCGRAAARCRSIPNLTDELAVRFGGSVLQRPAGRAGRAGGRGRGALRPGLDRRPARRPAHRGPRAAHARRAPPARRTRWSPSSRPTSST